jgi:hypothetical protein
MPLLDHLLEEVSKLLAVELAKWPPSIEELDSQLGAKFQPLFEPGAPRPTRALYREAFRLARWELQREVQAIDDYMRNARYLEVGLAPTDKLALLFVSRWLVEQSLGLAESTHGKVKRPDLLDLLDRLERRHASEISAVGKEQVLG